MTLDPATTLDALLTKLIAREQGYVNHPDDRGGPTNWGITQRTLAAYRDKPVTVADVKALTKAQAYDIYRALYWEQPGFNVLELHPHLIEMVFDAGVHHGTGRAVRFLQRAAGVIADGVIGPVTRKVVQSYDTEILASRFIGERLMFIAQLVQDNPSQLAFLEGWAARIREFILMISVD